MQTSYLFTLTKSISSTIVQKHETPQLCSYFVKRKNLDLKVFIIAKSIDIHCNWKPTFVHIFWLDFSYLIISLHTIYGWIVTAIVDYFGIFWQYFERTIWLEFQYITMIRISINKQSSLIHFDWLNGLTLLNLCKVILNWSNQSTYKNPAKMSQNRRLIERLRAQG